MKYIFDFDDVLFNNTAQFKKHMFEYMESIGVPRGVPEEYYKEIRGNQFSIRKFISGLLERYKINGNAEEIY
jgi:hypothetical protein